MKHLKKYFLFLLLSYYYHYSMGQYVNVYEQVADYNPVKIELLEELNISENLSDIKSTTLEWANQRFLVYRLSDSTAVYVRDYHIEDLYWAFPDSVYFKSFLEHDYPSRKITFDYELLKGRSNNVILEAAETEKILDSLDAYLFSKDGDTVIQTYTYRLSNEAILVKSMMDEDFLNGIIYNSEKSYYDTIDDSATGTLPSVPSNFLSELDGYVNQCFSSVDYTPIGFHKFTYECYRLTRRIDIDYDDFLVSIAAYLTNYYLKENINCQVKLELDPENGGNRLVLFTPQGDAYDLIYEAHQALEKMLNKEFSPYRYFKLFDYQSARLKMTK